MSEVCNQAYIFFCGGLSGMIVALIYDVFRIKRKTFKTRALMLNLEDLLYWVIVAIITFSVIYYSNDGEVRAYIFLGIMTGVVIYYMILSRAVMSIAMRFMIFAKKIFYKGDAILNALRTKVEKKGSNQSGG